MGSLLRGAGFQLGTLSLSPQAALAVWNIILRFMGDIPEPVLFARNTLRGGSVMPQTHDTPGRESGAQPPAHGGSTQVRSGRGHKGRTPFRGPQAPEAGLEGGGKTWSEHRLLDPGAPEAFQS